MTIALIPEEVVKVWAWIVVEAEPHHLLACFHEGTDGQFHMQWRIATREGPDDRGEDRKKSFEHVSRDLASMSEDDKRADIASFAAHMGKSLDASAVIIAVEGDVDKAFEMLEDIPGVTSQKVTPDQIH